MEVKKSPIFYMGNKERLIKKGLVKFFPKDIRTFVDLFCGSGIVSMNVTAEIYVLNDVNKTIIELLQYFEDYSAEEIIESIEATVKKQGLLKGFNKKDTRETDEYKSLAQQRYNEFRKHYNNVDKSILNLYILSYYCNNNNIRFNKKGEFNMPIGNQYFNKDKHSQKIVDGCNFFKNNLTLINNKDYKSINIDGLLHNDFVYLDPPYSNTTAIYNEQLGWTINDDYELFSLCEHLSKNGIRWAMSNVFENKGKVNDHLIKWVTDNNLKVNYFDGFNYVACGKGNGKTVEVLITNY